MKRILAVLALLALSSCAERQLFDPPNRAFEMSAIPCDQHNCGKDPGQ